MKILLTEYAERKNISANTALYKAKRGTLPTAEKIGKHWWIDEAAPYTDARIKTGDYIGTKYGYAYRKALREKKRERATR